MLTNFTDIRLAYAKRKEARVVHWHELQQKAYSLCISFGRDLGLYGEVLSREDGPDEECFQIGVFDNGRFKRASPADFHRTNLKVAFAIRLFVGTALDDPSECEVIVKLNLGKTADNYVAELLSSRGAIQFPISREFVETERKALFEAIVQEVIATLDARMMGGTVIFDEDSFALSMPTPVERLEQHTLLRQGENEQLQHDPSSALKNIEKLVVINQGLADQIIQLSDKVERLTCDLFSTHVENTA